MTQAFLSTERSEARMTRAPALLDRTKLEVQWALRAFAALTLIAIPLVTPVRAAEWPNRPLTMVIPFAAGGPMDTVGRILQPELGRALRQPVVIENIGGAGGTIGAARVAKAAPDGYEFVLGNVGTHAVSQTLYKNLPYNALTDFAPVALIADLSLVLVVRKDLPVNNLSEFIAYAKVNQDKMQFASAGAGSATHLGCALLNARIGVTTTHVPYRGGEPAMQDLIAGRIDYLCIDTPIAASQIEAGAVKAIAVLTRRRVALLPKVSTAEEQGLPDFDAANWSAFFLPKDTPQVIVRRLHDATIATVDDPAVRARLSGAGIDPVSADRQSSAYLEQFIVTEIAKWSGPIKALGLSAQ
jgi:tripartite-type tricarboxylate transporter receptor subunit TctC